MKAIDFFFLLRKVKHFGNQLFSFSTCKRFLSLRQGQNSPELKKKKKNGPTEHLQLSNFTEPDGNFRSPEVVPGFAGLSIAGRIRQMIQTVGAAGFGQLQPLFQAQTVFFEFGFDLSLLLSRARLPGRLFR